jgi:hypothetical protein
MELANNRNVGLESSTGIGKTHWLARVALWWLDSWDDSLVVIVGITAKQLRDSFWAEIGNAFPKFKRVRPDSVLLNGHLRIGDNKDEKSWMCTQRTSGLEANTQRKSVDQAQGLHRQHMLILFEEMPGLSHALFKTMKVTAGGYHNRLLGLGNPNSKLDPLHKFCKLASTTHLRASTYDHPNVVNKEEIIPGAVTEKLIEEIKTEYGVESWYFQSRIRGKCPDSAEDSLIKLEWIEQCIFLFDEDSEEFKNDKSNNACGVDPANSENGDKGGVAYGKRNILDCIEEFKCPNANHLAYNLLYDEAELIAKRWTRYFIPTIHQYEINEANVAIDSNGNGVATFNTFLEEGYDCTQIIGQQDNDLVPKFENGKPKHIFKGLRSQIMFMLREDLRNKKFSINIYDKEILDQLKEELTVPLFTDISGVIQVESKDEIKKRIGGRSPTLLDIVAYWNYARKKPKKGKGGIYSYS